MNVHPETKDKATRPSHTTETSLRFGPFQLYRTNPNLNAKVSRKLIYHGVAGQQSPNNESNKHGTLLIEFAISTNMIISST